jgi:hypothetical protein
MKKASSVRAFDNVDSRKGYSGLYRFGASYNPGLFTPAGTTKPKSGNYLLYWMANQALWRVDPREAKGLDATLSYDWSPGDLSSNNTVLTAGLRFNEPLNPDKGRVTSEHKRPLSAAILDRHQFRIA